jgi:hypothetical protein
VPGLHLELFDSSRSRRGAVGRWLAFAEGGEGSYSPKGMLETVERDGGSSWQSCPRMCCRVFYIFKLLDSFIL